MVVGKVCTKCKEWKLLSEFHKNHAKADGFAHQCKACVSERCRVYYAANREQITAYGRIRSRAYYRANPDKRREITARRRALKAGAEGSHTRAEFRGLCEQTGWVCLCCETPHGDSPLTVDHVVPLSKGGSNDILNIQPLCLSCNDSKGVKTIDYRRGDG